MDLKFWIWLLIIAGSLIARASKKKIPPAEPRRSDPDSDQNPYEEKRPRTFEELLDEIQRSKAGVQKPRVVPVERPPDEVPARPVLEDTNYDYRQHDTIYEIYENAKKEAFQHPSLEETLKLEDTIVRFKAFKGYQKVVQRNLAAELAQEIGNPSGFRKAFIMSEILRRKY
jgi:hypothetical protein